MSTIKIVDEDMKFKVVKIIDLREDMIFELIGQKSLSKENFAKWVENLRDEWFAIGANSNNGE